MKTKKNLYICMIGHKFVPSRSGGIEIVVEELGTRMVQFGHKVTCYNRRGRHITGKKFDTMVDDNYKGIILKSVITIDKKGLAAMTSSFFAAIRATFGTYDVIHFHAEGPCAMMWIPKLFGKRCIATVHGLDWEREKWSNGFASKYIKFGEKVAVKFADQIIVLSKGVQEYFQDIYGRKTVFIPNGVNRPQCCEVKEIKTEYGLEGRDYFLFLARLVPEKGLRYLIKAFKQVQTDKKLVIAGGASDSGDFVKELKELAKSDERILFTGFVQGRKLQELYSNAYVYTLPSDLEGMPLSLLEAMSFGNCALVSDIPECADVVEDKAVIFKKGDVNDLYKKLQFLCDNESTVKQYKNEAADFICNKYSWDDVVEQTLELYRR